MAGRPMVPRAQPTPAGSLTGRLRSTTAGPVADYRADNLSSGAASAGQCGSGGDEYPREHEGSYPQLRITASLSRVRLCAAAGQQRSFSLQRPRSGRERLNIISAAHAKLRPVGVSDPTATRPSVDVGVEASLDCASAQAPGGFPESSGVIARTATVEHPLVATSSPARLAGARVAGRLCEGPIGRSCAEQRRRGRRWPRCT
jgi:hypothetical protein